MSSATISHESGHARPLGDEELKMRKQKGFSLIELLIVVAIILIIAAIAIPNLLRARIAANESSAASGIRTINTAEVSYNSTYATVGYSAALKDLGPGGIAATCPTPPVAATACLIDGLLASGTAKNGYTYTYNSAGGPPLSSYQAFANPVVFNSSGVKAFCSFEDAVVRTDNGSTSGALGTCDGTVNPLQ
jgi:type IV pilus assembly protein PilA